MIDERIWGSEQQFSLLLFSFVFGFLLGVIFDLVNGFGRGKSAAKRCLIDVVFCVFSAFLTFFFTLIFTAGAWHPILLFGVIIGVYLEHILIGVWVSRSVYLARRWFRFFFCALLAIADRFARRIRFKTSNWFLKGKLRYK